MASRVFVWIVVLGLLVSCGSEGEQTIVKEQVNEDIVSQETLKKEEYISFFKEENSLKKTKKIGEIEYIISYVPKEMMALREIGSSSDEAKFKEACIHYEDMEYWDFRIKCESFNDELLKKDLKGNGDYTKRVSYCSFDIQKDLKIVVNNSDTINCGLMHYERTFNLGPEARFVIAFPKWKKETEEITFMFDDKLFNQGMIKLSYKNKNILNAPKLEFL